MAAPVAEVAVAAVAGVVAVKTAPHLVVAWGFAAQVEEAAPVAVAVLVRRVGRQARRAVPVLAFWCETATFDSTLLH